MAARASAVRIILVVLLAFPILIGVLVMLCGDYEAARGTLWPGYMRNDEELMRKHLYTMVPSLEFMADRYGAPEFETMERFSKASNVLAPMASDMQRKGLSLKGHIAAARDLNDYKNTLNAGELLVSERIADELFAVFLEKKYSVKGEELLTNIRSNNDVPDWLIDAYPDKGSRMAVLDSLGAISIAIMNHELNSSYVSYGEVRPPQESYIREPRWLPIESPEWRVWADFVRGLPGQYKWLITKEVYWRTFLRSKYGNNIADLNRRWGSEFSGFSEVPLLEGQGGVKVDLKDWRDFVHRVWPRHMLELPEGYDAQWREFLSERFAHDKGMLAQVLEGVDGDKIELPLKRPGFAAMDVLWCDFVEAGVVPAEEIRLISHADRFGPFLRSNYLGGRIISLNEEWGTSFEVFADVPLPLGLSDLALFPRESRELRRQYASDAWFDAVTDLRYPSGILRRTLVTVGLMVLGSLLLSVTTAYILARIPVRSSARILVWCVIASVFPVVSWLTAGGASVEGCLGVGRLPTVVAAGVTLLSCMFLRHWFFDVVRAYREQSCLDGVGEFGFIFRFVVRYSWPAVIYAAVIHFICIYAAIDWQILAMGRLWNWTLGVWAVNHGLSAPPLRAAVALVGILPPFFVVALCYPILTRYSLVPICRSRKP
jgi:ABC-type glycerol-3-phosphate transport system permease component